MSNFEQDLVMLLQSQTFYYQGIPIENRGSGKEFVTLSKSFATLHEAKDFIDESIEALSKSVKRSNHANTNTTKKN